MNISPMNPGPRIARAVSAFERRRTRQGREWVANFLNEKTVVIALHGSMTEREITLSGEPAGFARLMESRRELFGDAMLLQKIDRCCGMMVIGTTIETEPSTGGILLLFTTNTAGGEFPLSIGGPAKARTPRTGSLDHTAPDARRVKTTRYVRV